MLRKKADNLTAQEWTRLAKQYAKEKRIEPEDDIGFLPYYERGFTPKDAVLEIERLRQSD